MSQFGRENPRKSKRIQPSSGSAFEAKRELNPRQRGSVPVHWPAHARLFGPRHRARVDSPKSRPPRRGVDTDSFKARRFMKASGASEDRLVVVLRPRLTAVRPALARQASTARASPRPRLSAIRFEPARSPGEQPAAAERWIRRSNARLAWRAPGGPKPAV